MSSGPYLLVIDFEPRSLAKSRTLLEGKGYPVQGASNPKQVEAILKTELPALVLMEPMLPGQDGYKLCAALKRLIPDRPIPVMVASRFYRGPRYRNMAKEAGADAYFERPAQDEQILAMVARHITPRAPAAVGADIVASFTSQAIEVAPAAARPTSTLTTAPRPTYASATAAANAPRNTALDALSDGDIEDALARVLGSEPTGTIPHQAQRASIELDDRPLDVGFVLPDQHITRLPADFNLEQLGFALDQIELEGSSTALETATSTPAAPIASIDYALIEERDVAASVAPAFAVPQPAATPRFAVEASASGSVQAQLEAAPSGTVHSIDNFFDANFQAMPSELNRAAPEKQAASRGMTGESLADPALDLDQKDHTGPPPFGSGAHAVPSSLRGMDRGTAELLSSLEDLENSLPQPDNPRGGWAMSGELEPSSIQLETGLTGGAPLEVPPQSEEERSLEEMLARITSDETPPKTGLTGKTGSQPPQIKIHPPAPAPTPAPEDDIEFDLGFDPVPRSAVKPPPAKTQEEPMTVLHEIASQPVAIAEPRASRASRQTVAPPATFSNAKEEPPRSALGSVLWYALIGVVLGAVLLYAAFHFLGSSDTPPTQTNKAPVAAPQPEPMPPQPSSKPVATQTTPAMPATTHQLKGVPPATSSASNQRPPRSNRNPPAAASGVVQQRGGERETSSQGNTKHESASTDESEPAPASHVAASAPVKNASEPTVGTTPFQETVRLAKLVELDEPPQLLSRVEPLLPGAAEQSGVRGRVFLSVLIGDDGLVRDAKVMIEPGFGMGESAKIAVKNWRYSLPKSAGAPVRVWKTEVVDFGGSAPAEAP